jgi:hypothetical protein
MPVDVAVSGRSAMGSGRGGEGMGLGLGLFGARGQGSGGGRPDIGEQAGGTYRCGGNAGVDCADGESMLLEKAAGLQSDTTGLNTSTALTVAETGNCIQSALA